MIYVTGDTHGDFYKLDCRYNFSEDDIIIICGDFGLLWKNDRMFQYSLEYLAELKPTILWVQGNHENYNMIQEYNIDYWNGGKVRHIIKDKVILLERGQVFTIEGKTFFTMGGASSHDIQGGILDRNSPTYDSDLVRAIESEQPFRILNESWWKAELPSEIELQEGLNNLEKCDYKVDYVISHCASNNICKRLNADMRYINHLRLDLKPDVLTDYFDLLETKLDYKRWYFGHYHDNLAVDDKHHLLYSNFELIED